LEKDKNRRSLNSFKDIKSKLAGDDIIVVHYKLTKFELYTTNRAERVLVVISLIRYVLDIFSSDIYRCEDFR
jgi:hypothetical protein